MTERRDYDVAVIGGGVAGFTAALQLKEMRPKTRIALIEKREHPVPPTAYKVGESVADLGSHYLREAIGLDSHLENDHMRKMGLRWFCSADGNKDLSRRVEFGLIRLSPLKTFHIDRGEIENHLATLASDAGIDIRDDTTVSDVDIGDDRHTISMGTNGGTSELGARWVVDASGRQGFLRHKLGVGVDLDIDVGSSWFRTPYRLMVDDWCDDPAWKAEVPAGTRWKSTCSFLGQGYWSWVINLGSGAASVGIVADPNYVSWDKIRRYDALIEWLREVEPQLASHLPDDESGLLDFMKRKRFSHTCTRAFSRRRWGLTGEAAVFLDPLYSTGHDTGAIGNTLLTDLIVHDLNGEGGSDFSKRVRAHNRALLGTVLMMKDFFPGALAVYGREQSTGAKFLWDNVSYFTLLLNLFRTRAILDGELMRSLQPHMALNAQINTFMQERLREWGRSEKDFSSAGVPIASDFLFEHMVTTPLEPMPFDTIPAHVELSVRRLHTIARDLVARMSEAAGEPMPDFPYDPPVPTDEELVMWSDYDRRTRPPADRDPQPEKGWLIR